MLGKRLINTGGAEACTTDTTQILDAGATQSTALYRFEDNANDTAYTAGTTISSFKIIDLDVNGYSSGATISNSASNTDDAAIVGNVTYSNPSGSNGRFDLDGASDYLQIDANTTFNGATNYTLEGWFKPDNLTAVDHFFAIHDGSSGSKFYVRLNDAQGDIDALVYGSTGTGSSAATVVTSNTAARVQANVFNHVVMTYTDGSGGLLSIYINGVLAGSAAATGNGNTTGTSDLLIGTLGGYIGSYDFDGEVGQVRFYISALSATEVLQNYNATRALYAANHGTASNVTYAAGKFDKAGVFNGSSSKIALPAILPTNSTADSSVSFWFKYSGGQSGTGTLFSSYGGNSAQPGYHLGLEAAYTWNGVNYPDGSLFLTGYSMGTGSGVNGTTSYADGAWHHVVVTYDFSTGVLSCFVDNASSATLSVSFTSRPSTIGPFSQSGDIGYQLHGGPHRYAKCSIDQFRIFDKELTTSEINSLYNETAASAASGTIDNPSTVAYYKMADATDETGSYNGTATSVDFNVQGKYGFAGKFSGAGSNVETTLANSNFTSNYSISLWVNLTNANVFQNFVGNYKSSGGYGGFTFMSRNAGGGVYRFGFIWWTGSGSNYNFVQNSDVVATSGTWVHLVATKISGVLPILYVNGTANSLYYDNSDTEHGTTGENFKIGNTLNSNYSAGKIDQVRIFNKAISASEVTKLYNEVQCDPLITTPENYFNTKLYTGNGGTQAMTGVGFAPGMTWIKARSVGYSHSLQDILRGPGTSTSLYPDLNSSAGTYGAYGQIISFDTDGFTVASGGHGSYPVAQVNQNGVTYASWNWKAALASFSTSFNGSSSKIEVTNSGNVFEAVGGFSASVWVNRNTTANQTILNKEGAVSGSYGWSLRYSSGAGYSYDLYDTSDNMVTVSTGANSTTGTWEHVVISFNNSDNKLRIYYNGGTPSVSSALSSAASSNTENFFIGARTNSGIVTDGNLAQVRIYSTAVTDAQASNLYAEPAASNNTLNYPAGAGCIAAYPLQTDAVDLSGSGNYNGASSNVTFGQPGYLTSNTDGAIPSTVAANVEAGFSIVKYTGTGSTTTVGHGLNKKPNLIIFKGLVNNTTDAWPVYASPTTADFSLYLYHTYAAINDAANFSDTEPTSSVFTVGTWNGINKSSVDYIAYCISNIDGYQRVGSYIGNGSANGPFIYTGFEPAWIMFKNTDTAYRWYMLDNKRNTTNPRRSRLFANAPTAETTNSDIVDFHTNGFQIINSDAEVNKSGDKILFWAIAANPDTTAPTKANSFKTVLYTGNSGTNQITGLGFKPDLVWMKDRGNSYSNTLYDSVRGTGTGKAIYSDSNVEEGDRTDIHNFVSFDANGFTLGATSHTNNIINKSGGTLVAWAWKALDHDRNLASINNDGTIASQVSVNKDSGFSIVKYTGNGTAGATVGHGLGAKPQFILFKNLDTVVSWIAYDTINNVIGYLDATDSLTDGRRAWAVNNTDPTNTLVTLGNNQATNAASNFIMYCWHSVAGYSKIGTYTGNGSTDGPTVNIGFEPSWLMIKKTNDTGQWLLVDNARNPSNPVNARLRADRSNAESTSYNILNFLSNGFKIITADNDQNTNNGTYLYMAIK